jgi:hypothetical protein
MEIKLNHPQQKDLTLEELQDDVNAVKSEMDVFSLNKAYAFTTVTVQCLINKIKQQEEEKSEMLDALKEAKRMYESTQPTGGWQGVYDSICIVIEKQTEQ